MIIKGDDYEFRQINETSPFWDVYVLKMVRPKDCEPREELTNVGYGCSLSSSVSKVIHNRMNKKYFDKEGIIDLFTYIKEYTQSVKELQKLCNNEVR